MATTPQYVNVPTPQSPYGNVTPNPTPISYVAPTTTPVSRPSTPIGVSPRRLVTPLPLRRASTPIVAITPTEQDTPTYGNIRPSPSALDREMSDMEEAAASQTAEDTIEPFTPQNVEGDEAEPAAEEEGEEAEIPVETTPKSKKNRTKRKKRRHGRRVSAATDAADE
jgi:hypothetical protein